MGRREHEVGGVVTASLQASGARWRAVADGEWGLELDDVGGGPLHVGLRLHDGLLSVQAWAAPPGVLDAHRLLHRNRLGALARYAHSAAGDVHVHAEALAEGLTAAGLDRLLGAVVEAVEAARSASPPPYAARRRA
ncbi:MAG TPA: hypothetical protein VFT50_16610 [Baekduia sp.]|nr:hypothetical protein [Baekduia sp.]